MCVALLVGCAANIPHNPPAISDVSKADSVVRVTATNASPGGIFGDKWPPEQEINALGQEGCKIFGRAAVPLSWKCTAMRKRHCHAREYLFVCR